MIAITLKCQLAIDRSAGGKSEQLVHFVRPRQPVAVRRATRTTPPKESKTGTAIAVDVNGTPARTAGGAVVRTLFARITGIPALHQPRKGMPSTDVKATSSTSKPN